MTIEEIMTQYAWVFKQEVSSKEIECFIAKLLQTYRYSIITEAEGMKKDCCGGVIPCDENCRSVNNTNQTLDTLINKIK